MNLPDDWYVEHDGQSIILDSRKVADEIEQLRAHIVALDNALMAGGIENQELRAALEEISTLSKGKPRGTHIRIREIISSVLAGGTP